MKIGKVANLEKFENVVPHIVVHEFGIKAAEVGVIDIFEYQRRRLALEQWSVKPSCIPARCQIPYLTVPDHIKQCNNIRPPTQVLQDFDLSFYLLLLDRLEHLDDAFLVVLSLIHI